MNQKELLIASVVSTILYLLAMEYLLDIPMIGFFLAWVGWIVPLVFWMGWWEEGNKK